MEAIREYVKVENHRIVIDLPADFDAQDAEVIVLPVKMLAEGVEKLLDDGEASGRSPRSHDEIFDALASKYA